MWLIQGELSVYSIKFFSPKLTMQMNFVLRFHLTERIFWFLCLLLSIFGSYYLILQTLQDFDGSSVNTVVESLQAKDLIHFPSVGVCEIGIINDMPYSKLERALKE